MYRFLDALPFVPSESYPQGLPGKFSAAYNVMSLQQNPYCRGCHLGPVQAEPMPEDLCANCLIFKAGFVSSYLHRNEALFKDRATLLEALLKFSSAFKDVYKSKYCHFYPKCDNGPTCIFLHYDEDPNLKSVVESTLSPDSTIGLVAAQELSLPIILTGVFGSHYAQVAPLQVHDCDKCTADPSLDIMILPVNRCVWCLLNMKWADVLSIQNQKLYDQNQILLNMERSLKAYQQKKYRTRKCQIKDCADLRCPYAHTDEEVRGSVHREYQVGLIADILSEIG